MTHLKCNNLSINLFEGGFFRKRTILHNLTFDLAKGDRLALIGANGAGKSTLLKALGGILPPATGTVEVEGRVSALFNISLGTRQQSTGRKNMIFRNLIEGRSYEEIIEALPKMIEFADLGNYIDRPMATYSAGMAMRTVFAAATTFDPQILLLDEWIGAGDFKFRKKSNRRMRELVERSGIIVLATHRQQLARDICNLGLYLKDGRIEYFGKLEEAWKMYERADDL